jgi:hypothetical protein
MRLFTDVGDFVGETLPDILSKHRDLHIEIFENALKLYK